MFFLLFVSLFMSFVVNGMEISKDHTAAPRLLTMTQLKSAINQNNPEVVASLYKTYEKLSTKAEKKSFLNDIDCDELSALVERNTNLQDCMLEDVKTIFKKSNAAYAATAMLYTGGLLCIHGLTIGTQQYPILPYLTQSIIILGAIANYGSYHFTDSSMQTIKTRSTLIANYIGLMKKEKEALAQQ